MESIYDYLNFEFKSGLKDWETNLKKELKAESIEGLTHKPTVDGPLPVLSLTSEGHYLEVNEQWKKASQTYFQISQDIEIEIQGDLENGVRFFIFDLDLSQKDWTRIEKIFQGFDKKNELDILILGKSPENFTSDLKIISRKNFVSGAEAHNLGGSQSLELALNCVQFIEKEDPKTQALVYLDSEIFSNIAKLRAMRLLLMRISESWGVGQSFRLIALTSFRDWTLYERYSNVLKNVASVSAGYMGGADLVQSSGFLSLFEKYQLNLNDSDSSRSKILARNTSHILALESMLGVVEDPAFGSFHLENLTRKYSEEAWSIMQRLLPLSQEERKKEIEKLASLTRETREMEMRKRKHVMAGINDFPDEEVLGLESLPEEKIYRRSRSFEELRVRAENLKKKPEVLIAIQGNYAALNARVNFAKNYFQLLGLKVQEGEFTPNAKADILVVVAADEDYEKMSHFKTSQEMRFLAGKVSLEGFKNIHAGQDVYTVLDEVVKHWEAK